MSAGVPHDTLTEGGRKAIERRWATFHDRGAHDYTDAGCRVLAEHGFKDVAALLAELARVSRERDQAVEANRWLLEKRDEAMTNGRRIARERDELRAKLAFTERERDEYVSANATYKHLAREHETMRDALRALLDAYRAASIADEEGLATREQWRAAWDACDNAADEAAAALAGSRAATPKDGQ